MQRESYTRHTNDSWERQKGKKAFATVYIYMSQNVIRAMCKKKKTNKNPHEQKGKNNMYTYDSITFDV